VFWPPGACWLSRRDEDQRVPRGGCCEAETARERERSALVDVAERDARFPRLPVHGCRGRSWHWRGLGERTRGAETRRRRREPARRDFATARLVARQGPSSLCSARYTLTDPTRTQPKQSEGARAPPLRLAASSPSPSHHCYRVSLYCTSAQSVLPHAHGRGGQRERANAETAGSRLARSLARLRP